MDNIKIENLKYKSGNSIKELSLPVAPACNMMCSFCTKNIECMCNGNSIGVIRRTLTPRQGVNYVLDSLKLDGEIYRIRINGPGEPLANTQTYEVLKRLNVATPKLSFAISTNGLDLYDRVDELASLNVDSIDVSFSAYYDETIAVLYSRIIKAGDVINDYRHIKEELLIGQIEGIKKCIDYGMEVNINSMYFPGINDNDMLAIAALCSKLGVNLIKYVSCYPNGKLKNIHVPTLRELEFKKDEISKLLGFISENGSTGVKQVI